MPPILNPTDAVIVSYQRTPFGRARKGSFAEERPEDLVLAAVRATLSNLPELDPDSIDDFYLGTAVPEGAQGDNVARRVAVYAGYDELPGVTINRFCASSLQAVASAAQAIRSGDGDAYLVGGMESTSNTPPNTHHPYPGSVPATERMSAILAQEQAWINPRKRGELPDVYVTMGVSAEIVAQVTGTTRQKQDEWALESQRRAATAMNAGFFEREIAPYTRTDGSVVRVDDGPRPGTTLEGLAGLNPAFHPEGTVTAGNASPLNDGASAMLIMSASRAAELGVTPRARILGATASGLSPEIMGLGPVSATNKLLARLGLSVSDIDLIELNEAFAAQVVPSVEQIGADPAKVNVNGGAIALGHPFGATGVRLTGTLTNALEDRDGTLGLATLCVGGGQGMALVLERV